MGADVRRATPRDEPLVAALLGSHPEHVLGGVLAADLVTPGPDSAAFLAGGGYARVARGARPKQWTVALAGGDAPSRVAVLTAAAAHAASRGGGRLTWWAAGATPDDDRAASAAGFHVARAQHQLRVPLPVDELPAFPSDVKVRDFDVARDAGEWLVVNNTAFAGHSEQGDWTPEVLGARVAESWFDPTLFVVADDADGMAGFNWLKVHTAEEQPLGEIYVIAVAPGRQGRGLGRALALEGLRRLAARGITNGMLYVADDNDAALALYRSLGFATYRTDRAYEREVGAS